MATQSILVEDCSPLIQYAPEGAWQDAQANDTLAASYSGGSYHVSSTQGATATFQFRGTGFTITGGRRPGYGPFSLSLDGQQLFNGNPAPASSPIKNTLVTMSGLPNDLHTVVLTNSGGAPVDIDAITFQVRIGSVGASPNITTIDDNDQRISYLPSATDWNLNPRPEFQDGTLHYSQAPDASASLQFTGNAVALYGTVSPDHADISVTVDGKTVTMPLSSGSRVVAVRTQILLYWADGLPDGQHTMTVSKVQSANTGPFIDIDSFTVYSAPQTPSGVTGTAAPSGDSTSSPPASKKPNRTAIIAGASAAGALALLLIIVGVFLIVRQRRQRQKSSISKSGISPITPILPMQGMMESGLKSTVVGGENPAFPFPPSATLTPVRKSNFNYKRSSKLSIAPSYYGDPDFASSSGTYERQMTSSGSSGPLMPPVPRLTAPSLPGIPRTIPALVVTDTSSSPSRSPRPLRPQRPPTLHIGSLQ